MVALTKDLSIKARMPRVASSYGYPVKAGVRIFRGAIVGITATKLAAPAGTAGVVALIGISDRTVDNRFGVDGAEQVKIDKGVFMMPVTGAAPVNIGAAVYAADDQTLQLTNASSELKLGVIEAIDAEGVWIRI